MARKKLTIKQKKFVDETIKTLNPTEAVRRVYDLGSKKGKKLDNTARSIASENLTKPNIRYAIQEALSVVNPNEIVDMFTEILRDKKDKRARLEAGKELAKLLDMYPAQKRKIVGLFDTISNLEK